MSEISYSVHMSIGDYIKKYLEVLLNACKGISLAVNTGKTKYKQKDVIEA